MKDRIVDLVTERAARKPAATRFVLEVRDAGSTPHEGRFLWDWTTEDRADCDQFRPSSRQIGWMLRRIADRFDPQPARRIHRRRHRVVRSR